MLIDADKLGHEAYNPGTECFHQLVSTFGEVIVTSSSTIDRKALGAIVFSDPSKMRQLESIVWPEIRRLLQLRLTDLRGGELVLASELGGEGEGEQKRRIPELVVVEAAVMIEAG